MLYTVTSFALEILCVISKSRRHRKKRQILLKRANKYMRCGKVSCSTHTHTKEVVHGDFISMQMHVSLLRPDTKTVHQAISNSQQLF